MQLGVAFLVALERRAGAVVAPAVELDDEVVRRPPGVELVAAELGVHHRAREAVAVAQVAEGGLEVAAGVGEILREQLPQRVRSRSTGACGQH
jgi:hypothetical protein